MTRLPPYHVARSRLTDRCQSADALVVVVEAAAGYGKSVFAAELVDSWGAVPIEVLLEEGRVSARLLVGRLRAAVARAGFVEAEGQMSRAREDPAGAVDAMVTALAGEVCAIVVDDAHHVTRDAGQLLEFIAGAISAPQRLVILARRLPPGTERLRRAGTVHFLADDLALLADESVELCRTGCGLKVTSEDGRLLDSATGSAPFRSQGTRSGRRGPPRDAGGCVADGEPPCRGVTPMSSARPDERVTSNRAVDSVSSCGPMRCCLVPWCSWHRHLAAPAQRDVGPRWWLRQ
jgi:hypothetical protein